VFRHGEALNNKIELPNETFCCSPFEEKVLGQPHVAEGVSAVIVPGGNLGKDDTNERFYGATDGLGQTSLGKRPEPASRYRTVVTGSRTEKGASANSSSSLSLPAKG
jgi:hypothetical protein